MFTHHWKNITYYLYSPYWLLLFVPNLGLIVWFSVLDSGNSGYSFDVFLYFYVFKCVSILISEEW